MAKTALADVSVPLSPALAGARAVAVGHAGIVRLIDGASGGTLWDRSLAETEGATACAGQPVCVAIVDQMVLAGSMGHVFALRIEDGSVLWHVDHRSRGSGDTCIAVGGGGEDYVASLGLDGGIGTM